MERNSKGEKKMGEKQKYMMMKDSLDQKENALQVLLLFWSDKRDRERWGRWDWSSLHVRAAPDTV